jgi:hypothetical protein
MWYKLYGDVMGGIFFDEARNECVPRIIYRRDYGRLCSSLYQYFRENTK